MADKPRNKNPHDRQPRSTASDLGLNNAPITAQRPSVHDELPPDQQIFPNLLNEAKAQFLERFWTQQQAEVSLSDIARLLDVRDAEIRNEKQLRATLKRIARDSRFRIAAINNIYETFMNLNVTRMPADQRRRLEERYNIKPIDSSDSEDDVVTQLHTISKEPPRRPVQIVEIKDNQAQETGNISFGSSHSRSSHSRSSLPENRDIDNASHSRRVPGEQHDSRKADNRRRRGSEITGRRRSERESGSEREFIQYISSEDDFDSRESHSRAQTSSRDRNQDVQLPSTSGQSYRKRYDQDSTRSRHAMICTNIGGRDLVLSDSDTEPIIKLPSNVETPL